MKIDPAASMRCWAIDVELAGRTYEIPAMPAADWWPVLADGDLTQILDPVVSNPEDPLNLDELLLSGELESGELESVLKGAVEEASGRSMHVCLVLVHASIAAWPVIGGQLAQRGFRWDVMPIGAALDAIYSILMESLPDKDAREKFLAVLENDALTEPGKKRAVSERAASEFETLAGPKPSAGVRSTGGPSGSARPRTRTRPRPPRRDAP